MWTDKADDGDVEATARTMFENIEADARKLGEYDPFVYLNYASAWQDPIASYGKESVEYMRKVKAKVDPHGLFTTKVPGGFKIPS